MKKSLLIILSIVIVTVLSIVLVLVLNKKDDEIKEFIPNDDPFVYDGKFSDVSIVDFNSAKNSLNDIKENLGITNVSTELKESFSNEYNGNKFYRFNQYYNNIRVYGNEVIVATNGNNADYLYSNTELVKANIGKEEFSYTEDEISNKFFNIVDDSELKEIEDLKIEVEKIYYKLENKYISAYYINVLSTNNIIDRVYIIDNDLKVLTSFSNISFYNYIAKEYDDNSVSIEVNRSEDKKGRTVYSFKDDKRKIKLLSYSGTNYDSIMKDDEKIDRLTYDFVEDKEPNSYYVTVFHRFEKVYDFYTNVLGYKGVDNNNGEIIVFVGSEIPSHPDNSCHMMSNHQDVFVVTAGFDNENSSIMTNNIVFAHEYTHGVFGRITGIRTSGINEGYADVMGILSVSYHNKEFTFDVPARNPISKDDSCPTCFYHTSDIRATDDEHDYATILSHALYLMTRGEAGIKDVTQMSKLWYLSMYYLPSNPKYSDVYYALIKSANMNHLKTDEIAHVASSLSEVGIRGKEKKDTFHNFCRQTRCLSIMEDGLLYFYDLNGNPIKPDKITVYTHIYETDNLENKVEYKNPKEVFKIPMPPNEVLENEKGEKYTESAYLIEIEYRDAVKKVYVQVCAKNDESVNDSCTYNEKIYLDEVFDKNIYDEDKNTLKKQGLVCTMEMDVSMFSSDEFAKEAIKDLNAQIEVDYKNNDKEINKATLSMNFVIDLNALEKNDAYKYVDKNYLLNQLKNEIKNLICGSYNYNYCDVIQKDNGFTVSASDNINKLINYNDSDQSRDKLRVFIEKRGFKCN